MKSKHSLRERTDDVKISFLNSSCSNLVFCVRWEFHRWLCTVKKSHWIGHVTKGKNWRKPGKKRHYCVSWLIKLSAYVVKNSVLNLHNLKNVDLLDISHGTFWCHTQYKAREYRWIWKFSYEHRPKCHTSCLSFPKCLGILKWVSRLRDSHGDRSVEFFCWLHCEHSNRWPQYQTHLKRSKPFNKRQLFK